MFLQNLILTFICFIHVWNIIYGFTIENHYTKNVYTLDDKILNGSTSILSDIQQMKLDIGELKKRIGASGENDQSPFDINRDTLPSNCVTKHPYIPLNCADATRCTHRSGIYRIQNPLYNNGAFLVECHTGHMGGDWTVIQRRQDGSENFHRTWSEYKTGFGSINGEYFIGLDKLYAITNYEGPQELLILMENGANAKEEYALYSAFQIGNESEKYVLKQLGRYNGTAGNSLQRHLGQKFSTKDQDNDIYDGNCAELYVGAWWYDKCHVSNLNGLYGNVEYAKGITWHTLTGYQASLSYVQMMVRRRRI